MHFSKASLVILVYLFATFFAGCKNDKKTELAGEWYINPYGDTYVLEAENEHAVLRLYPEGTFTQFGELGYSAGTWKLNLKGNYLKLTRKEGTLPLTNEYLKIKQIQSDKMMAGIYKDISFDANGHRMLVQWTKHLNHSDTDPFAAQLQAWRLKPQQPETEANIRKRVKNYLQFLRSLYKHAADNQFQNSNNWYPSPIRMDFGGGVRMAYSTELNNWYKCFYDTAQATKGYQIISGPIQDITLKKGVSESERNLDCIEQLLEKIKN